MKKLCVLCVFTINEGGARTLISHLKSNIYTYAQPYQPQNDKRKTRFLLLCRLQTHQQSAEPHHSIKQQVTIINVSVIQTAPMHVGKSWDKPRHFCVTRNNHFFTEKGHRELVTYK